MSQTSSSRNYKSYSNNNFNNQQQPSSSNGGGQGAWRSPTIASKKLRNESIHHPDVRSDTSSIDSNENWRGTSNNNNNWQNNRSGGGKPPSQHHHTKCSSSAYNKNYNNNRSSSYSKNNEVAEPITVNSLSSLVDQAGKKDCSFVVQGFITEIFSEEFAYYLSDQTATVRLVCNLQEDGRIQVGQAIKVEVKKAKGSTFYEVNSSLKYLNDIPPPQYLVESSGVLMYIKKTQEFIIYKQNPMDYGNIEYSFERMKRIKLEYTDATYDYSVLTTLLSNLSEEKIKELDDKWGTKLAGNPKIVEAFEDAIHKQQENGKNIHSAFGVIRGKYSPNDSLPLLTLLRELGEEVPNVRVVFDENRTILIPGLLKLERLNQEIKLNGGSEESTSEYVRPDNDVQLPLVTLTKLIVWDNISDEHKEILKNGVEQQMYYSSAIYVPLADMKQYFGEENTKMIIEHLGDDL